mmetsp:Transcript_8477/g.10175  ORF Transcript_8477/g.10175 Transcript_8477/m.10175 type:complete len:220 (-) Transcript_8477:899-1558(-)
MGRILLIRHGQTDGNRLRVVQPPSMSLSTMGKKQAEMLATRIKTEGYNVTKIISSDLARAKQTAMAIASKLGMEIEEEPLLQERNFGDVRGQSYDALIKQGVNILDKAYEPPNGDSVTDFAHRCEKAWEKVKNEATALGDDEHLCVVTHGLVLRNFLHRVQEEESAGLKSSKKRNLDEIPNTAVTFVQTKPFYMFHKDLINTITHLEETDVLGKKRLYL